MGKPGSTAKKSLKKKTNTKVSYFKCSQCLGYFKLKDKKIHVCDLPTENTLLRIMNNESQEAWIRLKSFADSLGEQRRYNSAKAIMFARRICYFFVRPKAKGIELTFFLNRKLVEPTIKRVIPYSKTKYAHVLMLVHSDQIEEPLTDWLREAWDLAL